MFLFDQSWVGATTSHTQSGGLQHEYAVYFLCVLISYKDL